MASLPTPKELRESRQDQARRHFFGPIVLAAMLRGQARRKQRKRTANAQRQAA